MEFLEAVRYDPSSPTPWQNLAVLYHKQGVSTVQGLAQCASKEAAVEISRTASHALGEADNAWRKVMELVDDQRTKQETVTRLAQVLQLRGRAVAIEDPAAALPHFLEATQLLSTEPSAWEAPPCLPHRRGRGQQQEGGGAARVLRFAPSLLRPEWKGGRSDGERRGEGDDDNALDCVFDNGGGGRRIRWAGPRALASSKRRLGHGAGERSADGLDPASLQSQGAVSHVDVVGEDAVMRSKRGGSRPAWSRRRVLVDIAADPPQVRGHPRPSIPRGSNAVIEEAVTIALSYSVSMAASRSSPP